MVPPWNRTSLRLPPRMQGERMHERPVLQMHVQRKPPPRSLMVAPHAKGVGGRGRAVTHAVGTPPQRPPIVGGHRAARPAFQQPLRGRAGIHTKRDNGHPWSASAIALCVNQSKTASHGAQGCPAPTRQRPLRCPGWPSATGAAATPPVRKWFPSSVRFNGSIEALLRMSGYGDIILSKQPLPPILILGVGHSGTSSVSCALHIHRQQQLKSRLSRPGVKPIRKHDMCEPPSVVKANEAICQALGWTWCTRADLGPKVWNERACPLVVDHTSIHVSTKWRGTMDHFMMNASVPSTVALGGRAAPDANVSNTTGVESGGWPYHHRLLSWLRDDHASPAASLARHERRELRELRQRLLQIMSSPAVELRQEMPIIWKDPRFTWTLHIWQHIWQELLPHKPSRRPWAKPATTAATTATATATARPRASQLQPLLIHVRRDPKHVLRSYQRRPAELCFLDGPTPEAAIASRIAWTDWQFEQWCGPKVSLDVASFGGMAQNHVSVKS